MSDNQQPEPISTTSPDDSEADWNLLGEEVSTETPSIEGGAGLMSPDDFYGNVKFVLATAGFMLKLESLPIQHHEEDAARKASDAVFVLAEKSPIGRFFLDLESPTMKAILTVGAFAVPKGLACIAESNAKKAAAIGSRRSSVSNDNAANDNTAAQQAGLGPFANDRPAS